MTIDDLLKLLISKRGSDLHLKVGLKPILRVKGELEAQGHLPEITAADMKGFIDQVLAEQQKGVFEKNREVDTSYELGGIARFRGNIFL